MTNGDEKTSSPSPIYTLQNFLGRFALSLLTISIEISNDKATSTYRRDIIEIVLCQAQRYKEERDLDQECPTPSNPIAD